MVNADPLTEEFIATLPSRGSSRGPTGPGEQAGPARDEPPPAV